MEGLPPIDPEYTPSQRQSLDRIDYLLAELDGLRDRGLISGEVVEAVRAEKEAIRGEVARSGLAMAALKSARALGSPSPREALARAEQARALDPGQVEAWELSAWLLARLGEYRHAVDVCREAAEVHGHAALKGRIAGLEDDAARAERAAGVAAAWDRARLATLGGDDETALAAARETLAIAPGHPLALGTAIRCLVALRRLDEAEELCRTLRQSSPLEAGRWIERIRAERARALFTSQAGTVKVPEVAWIGDDAPTHSVAATPVREPDRPWSSAASQFLEDHWQKLILSLAVLLIVVSSTVGAAIVLGDRLWMAEGKCLLATAYTLMFAGFGRGLARWGAERAGRIMSLTTLIVLPVNFALVGELPGLGTSSTLGLAVLAVDTLAMIGLAWVVCRRLGISGGKGTPAALIALGLIDALTPRSASFPLAFGSLLGASFVFAAAGEWLGRWLGRHREADESDAPLFAIGLLAFYDLAVLGRIGGYVLHLPPTLYALPAMLGAFATVRLADGLRATGRADRSAALVRLAGYSLSALGIALGLARPAGPNPLLSGNVLATAVLGLLLYARGLNAERRPGFLYAAFAALFLAYFGAYDFLKDFMASVEGSIGQRLGYGRKLPMPFKALNGLVFNAVLAALSLSFARRWRDARLARHCHRIGLPLSLAACLLAAFEPMAAVLTMGGYALAYAVATWLFRTPRLAYLSCAAFTGAAVSGSTYLGELAAGSRSLAMAGVGLVLWASCRCLGLLKCPDDYRRPVVDSSLVIAFAALGFAAYAAWGPPSVTVAAAGWVLTVLYLLIGLETPLRSVALAVVSCAAVASILTIQLVAGRSGWAIDGAQIAAFAAGLGLIYEASGRMLKRLADRGDAGRSATSRLEVYPTPFSVVGLILVGLATWLIVADLPATLLDPTPGRLAVLSGTMAIEAIALALALALWGEGLAMASTLAGPCSGIVGTVALMAWRGWPASPATLALACSGWSAGLIGLGDRIRGLREGWPALYRRPLLVGSMLAVGLTWAVDALAPMGSDSLAASLALTALALLVAVRQEPIRPVPELALTSGLLAWLIEWGPPLDVWRDAPGVGGRLILFYLVAVIAGFEIIRRLSRRAGPSEARRVFAEALPDFALIGAALGLALGVNGAVADDFANLTTVLGLGSAVFFWARLSRPSARLEYVGLILACLATASGTRWAVGDEGPGLLLGWIALTASLDAAILCGLRWFGRGRGAGKALLQPLRDVGLFVAGMAFGASLIAASYTLDAYPMAVSALVLVVPTLAISARLDRSPRLVNAATIVGVAAAYLTLFELGRGRTTGHVSSLGVLASLLAVALWGIERFASRRRWADWHPVFAVPLRDGVVAMAILAIPFGWDTVLPPLFACVPFLLLLKSRPTAGWLYPAIGLVLGSGTVAVLHRWGAAGLTPWGLVAAFALWGLGLALTRARPSVYRRLTIPEDLPYEFPAYQWAMAAAAGVIWLRLDALLNRGEPWTGSPWVPAALGVLSLLMLRAYPHQGWVDGFAGLLSLALVMTCGPRVDSIATWGLLGMSLALAWRLIARVTARVEVEACRRMGVGYNGVADVLERWATGLLGVGCLPIALDVGGMVLGATLGLFGPFPAPAPGDWWLGLIAIPLLGVNLAMAGRVLGGDWAAIAPHLTATLGLWWLSGAGSPPMIRLGLDPTSMLPMVTAAQALATAALAVRSSGRAVGLYAFGLAVVAAILTGGRVGTATTATLLLATAALGHLAVATRGEMMAGMASVVWCLALGFGAEQVARRLGWDRGTAHAAATAVALTVAALGLVIAGRWDRLRGLGLARVVEGVAAVALGIASAAIGLGLVEVGGPDPGRVALVEMGVMSAVASLCVVLAARWASMPMAFAAQAAILLGYAAYRSGFAMSPMADASAMLVLAGVELGLAEVAGRSRRVFALPSLSMGLALPLISLGLSIRGGLVGDESLFALFAAGTFYAATCGRLRWKALGYAAAVLYNAALWVLWARDGWKLAESPQFYLVPVGFSTILFAEANRRDLGRPTVNAIRGVGLTLIYLALAFPIWQSASLAAWAGVLLISLIGIFAGIGLRSQAFLWLGLSGFLLDVVYQVGRIGMEHALAKWAIMLVLGIGLVLFVALNETRRILPRIKKFVDIARQWD